MPQTLDYLAERPRPRPSVGLQAVSALWLICMFLWAVKTISDSLEQPQAGGSVLMLLIAVSGPLGILVLVGKSLLGRSPGATRAIVTGLAIIVLVILFMGFASAIRAMMDVVRLAVAWIIVGGTLVAGAFAALSAWPFRCWLREIEWDESRWPIAMKPMPETPDGD